MINDVLISNTIPTKRVDRVDGLEFVTTYLLVSH